jgi:hypothetical protein
LTPAIHKAISFLVTKWARVPTLWAGIAAAAVGGWGVQPPQQVESKGPKKEKYLNLRKYFLRFTNFDYYCAK